MSALKHASEAGAAVCWGAAERLLPGHRPCDPRMVQLVGGSPQVTQTPLCSSVSRRSPGGTLPCRPKKQRCHVCWGQELSRRFWGLMP